MVMLLIVRVLSGGVGIVDSWIYVVVLLFVFFFLLIGFLLFYYVVGCRCKVRKLGRGVIEVSSRGLEEKEEDGVEGLLRWVVFGGLLVGYMLLSGIEVLDVRVEIFMYWKYVDRLDGYVFSYFLGWI